VHSQTYNKVARQLNERPRKTLTFETPAERFNACVASTVEPTTLAGHFRLIVDADADPRFSLVRVEPV
jgi:hypothetical protein